MEIKEIKSIIESLLFAWGDPLSIKDIADVLNIDKKKASLLLQEMMEELDKDKRGLQIVQTNKSYQICTRPQYYPWISKLCSPKNSKGLTNTALETLSIVAYKQPITKAEIEAIRGVRCDRAIRYLIEQNLISEVGKLDKPGRPRIFGTTDDFLRYFGIKNISELPKLNILEKNIEEETHE
ncbi:SMC-Scp complex subunit ScpB [Clostridiaceae bacterium M8S5]|nr:SMC-Scp complex subunit ScpB [Clostridiaceae bacterium M8S5]